jgi:hypothetical protein
VVCHGEYCDITRTKRNRGLRNLHDEELNSLYSSSDTVNMHNSKTVRSVGRVAHMGTNINV